MVNLVFGSNDNNNFPQKNEYLKDIDFIECGGFHVFCKSLDNILYCWGCNNIGQLGIGTTSSFQNFPMRSIFKHETVDVKCGANHSLLLTEQQEVFSCGSNSEFQLGRESDYNSHLFENIDSLREIVRIECGSDNSICFDTYNNIYVFGYNYRGQLGLGSTEDVEEPMKHPLSNIIDISKGGEHTFVKTSNNEIYAFGRNYSSQLGIETKDKIQLTPIRVFEDNEDIWFSNINKSKAKSARF